MVVRKKTPNPWKAIMNDSVKIYNLLTRDKGFPVGSGGKESACQYRRHKRCGFDPWVRKIPWRRGIFHGNPLQYSCLENPMDRGAWWATGHGIAESDTTEVT